VPKKPPAKKSLSTRTPRRVAGVRGRRLTRAKSRSSSAEGKLAFNHATIYVKDVGRALHFYRDLLGFKPIEDFRVEDRPVYARLKAPGGDATIALHQAGANDSVASDGVRLYFEVRELDDFCRKLQQKNFFITRLPAMMPWGWRHAYLNDPDGHEISLYWAGENRMKKTMQQAIKKAARSGSSAR
jgi:catechol 2,3-dioxygenase-like lactoylglutathione lyase family enzyme